MLNQFRSTLQKEWFPWATLRELESFGQQMPWIVERCSEDSSVSQEPNILTLLHRQFPKRPDWAFGKNTQLFLTALHKSISAEREVLRLYIDTCHWTHLADVDANCGERLGANQKVYEALHKKIVHLSQAGQLKCPLSLPLLIETFAQGSEKLRLRKARFMEFISKNTAVLFTSSVQHWEVRHDNIASSQQIPPPLTTVGWQLLGGPTLRWFFSNSQQKLNLKRSTFFRLLWNTWSIPYSELSNLSAPRAVKNMLVEGKALIDEFYGARRRNGYFDQDLSERHMSEYKRQTPVLYEKLSTGLIKPEQIPAFYIHGLLTAGFQDRHSNQIKTSDISDSIHLNDGLASCDVVWCDAAFHNQLLQKGILQMIPRNRKIIACPHEVLQILEKI